MEMREICGIQGPGIAWEISRLREALRQASPQHGAALAGSFCIRELAAKSVLP